MLNYQRVQHANKRARTDVLPCIGDSMTDWMQAKRRAGRSAAIEKIRWFHSSTSFQYCPGTRALCPKIHDAHFAGRTENRKRS